REKTSSTAFAEAKSFLRKLLPPADFETLFPPSPPPPPLPPPPPTSEGEEGREGSNVQPTPPVSNHTISDVQRCLEDAQTSYETRIRYRPSDLTFQTMMIPVAASPSTSSSPTNAGAAPRRSGAEARLWFTGLSERLLYYGNIFDVLAQHHPEYVALAWGTLKFLLVAVTNHATTASKLSASISHIAELVPQHAFHLILYPTREMQTAWYRDSRPAHAFKSIFQPWDIRFRGEYEAVAATAQQVGRLADVALKAEVRDIMSEVMRGRVDLKSVSRKISELQKENQRMESSRGDNALLLIDTYSSYVAKTFMIDLIDLILQYQLPIIWALRYANFRDRSIGVTDIARTLVLHTMQASADRLLDSPFPVTVEQLRGAAGLDEWIAILNRLLSSMDHAFIVLDADLLTHATAYERGQVLEMLDLLISKLSGNVKIVTSTSCVGPSYVRELEDLDACIRVQTGNAGDWRKTLRQRRRAMRFRKW
ncbi:MAG: hypothetical protein Q9228_004011, partial [Teloschistes exilis]